MSKRRRHKAECLYVGVPREACRVRFGPRTAVVVRSERLPWNTSRGEWIIADFDAEGGVIDLELIGSGKPCQEEIVDSVNCKEEP